jgi:hypothetical protein
VKSLVIAITAGLGTLRIFLRIILAALRWLYASLGILHKGFSMIELSELFSIKIKIFRSINHGE